MSGKGRVRWKKILFRMSTLPYKLHEKMQTNSDIEEKGQWGGDAQVIMSLWRTACSRLWHSILALTGLSQRTRSVSRASPQSRQQTRASLYLQVRSFCWGKRFFFAGPRVIVQLSWKMNYLFLYILDHEHSIGQNVLLQKYQILLWGNMVD